MKPMHRKAGEPPEPENQNQLSGSSWIMNFINQLRGQRPRGTRSIPHSTLRTPHWWWLVLLLPWAGPLLAAPAFSSITNLAANPASIGLGERVGPGDKVAFTIAEDPQAQSGPQNEIMVGPKFDLHFPVCHGYTEEVVVNAENKTLAQIERELKQKLDATYYKDATVKVVLGAQVVQPGKITITGPVRNNFVMLLPGERKKLLEVILQAGATEFANLKKVKILRVNSVTGKTEEKIINVEAIKKDPTKDVPVFDGDRLDIVEKNILFN
jgi:protein involved in polysaccharide export with SLBB domain